MLEVMPDAFVRVQIRCVGWQTFQPDAFTGSRRQEGLDGSAAVDWGTIPDDQQVTVYLFKQLGKKCHDAVTVEGNLLYLQPELTFW